MSGDFIHGLRNDGLGLFIQAGGAGDQAGDFVHAAGYLVHFFLGLVEFGCEHPFLEVGELVFNVFNFPVHHRTGVVEARPVVLVDRLHVAEAFLQGIGFFPDFGFPCQDVIQGLVDDPDPRAGFIQHGFQFVHDRHGLAGLVCRQVVIRPGEQLVTLGDVGLAHIIFGFQFLDPVHDVIIDPGKGTGFVVLVGQRVVSDFVDFDLQGLQTSGSLPSAAHAHHDPDQYQEQQCDPDVDHHRG